MKTSPAFAGAQRFRVASLLLVALVLVIYPAASGRADTSAGTGVIVRSPLVMAATFWLVEGGQYVLVAHHDSPDFARVVLVRRSGPAGLAEIDDVLVPATDLSYRWNSIRLSWEVTLDTTLPTFGHLKAIVLDPWGFQNRGVACAGFYEFYSVDGGMSHFGNITGTLEQKTIKEGLCIAWGTDVSGVYTNLPLAF